MPIDQYPGSPCAAIGPYSLPAAGIISLPLLGLAQCTRSLFGQRSQRDPDIQLPAEDRSQVPTPLQYFLEAGSDPL